MKKLTFLALVIFLITPGASAQEKAAEQPDPGRKDEKTVAQPSPAEKSRPLPPKTEPWPRTFVPSEKISADTVVSFPADI